MESIADIVRKGARRAADKECLVFEDKRYTYKQLDERTNRLANYLIKFKFDGYKHISVLADNCSQFAEVYYASAKAGTVTNPLNTRLAVNELAAIVKDAESKIIFYSEGYGDTVRAVAKEAGIKTIIAFEKEEPGSLNYEKILAGESPVDPNLKIDENQLAILIYTGGTTGKSKGVMISHRNFFTGLVDLTMTYRFSANDISCIALAMFHIAVWPVFSVMIARGKAVILRKADLDKIMQTIQNEKCTHMMSVPTILNWLMERPDLKDYNLSSLKILSYGGSPISPTLLQKIMDHFGKISFLQGYGLTEAAPGICTLLPEDHVLQGPPEITARLHSVGQQMFFVNVKVVKDDGTDAAPGEVGEVVGYGKNIMLGYWKMPDKTKDSIIDGWLHTGDLGYMDKAGYLFLVDRKNDMIITGGENVYPNEVENLLAAHPAIMEAVVIGVPDQKWGEAVKAIIVLKQGKTATADELIKFCKGKLAGYKCPKSIEFKDAIPKTAAGKISRAALKKEYWKGQDRMIS